ncbi:MAG: hypothetical protein IJX07_04555 [Bacillales bacterium]|nr:hypothetical protein [Bacillales bacterium]
MKRKTRLILSIVITLIILILYAFIFLMNQLSKDIKMYADIKDLKEVEFKDFEKTEIDNKDDQNIKDLSYQEYYGAAYVGQGDKIILYAYIFDDVESAKQYRANIADGGNYMDSGYTKRYLFVNEMVVMDHEKVYYVKAKNDKIFDEFLENLNQYLDLPLSSYEIPET